MSQNWSRSPEQGGGQRVGVVLLRLELRRVFAGDCDAVGFFGRGQTEAAAVAVVVVAEQRVAEKAVPVAVAAAWPVVVEEVLLLVPS